MAVSGRRSSSKKRCLRMASRSRTFRLAATGFFGSNRADSQPLSMRLNKPTGLAFGITPAETAPDGCPSCRCIRRLRAKAGMVARPRQLGFGRGVCGNSGDAGTVQRDKPQIQLAAHRVPALTNRLPGAAVLGEELVSALRNRPSRRLFQLPRKRAPRTQSTSPCISLCTLDFIRYKQRRIMARSHPAAAAHTCRFGNAWFSYAFW